MRVVWRDKSRLDDPSPALNRLEYYINRSKIEGIGQAYTNAINEYVEEYNSKCAEIVSLKQEVAFLKSKLDIWNNQQHGRRSVLNDINRKNIDIKKEKGLSNRQIAKDLNISEGTVRNYLKSKL